MVQELISVKINHPKCSARNSNYRSLGPHLSFPLAHVVLSSASAFPLYRNEVNKREPEPHVTIILGARCLCLPCVRVRRQSLCTNHPDKAGRIIFVCIKCEPRGNFWWWESATQLFHHTHKKQPIMIDLSSHTHSSPAHTHSTRLQ